MRPEAQVSAFQTPDRSTTSFTTSSQSSNMNLTAEKEENRDDKLELDKEYRRLSREVEEIRADEALYGTKCRRLEDILANRERAIANFERKLAEIWRKARSPREASTAATNELATARRQADDLALRLEKAKREADEARIAAETAHIRYKAAALRENQLQDRLYALERDSKSTDLLPIQNTSSQQLNTSSTIIEKARSLAEENDRFRFALAKAERKALRAEKKADLYASVVKDTTISADNAVIEAYTSVADLRDALQSQETAIQIP